jgi:CRP-like cAMP-binding protein
MQTQIYEQLFNFFHLLTDVPNAELEKITNIFSKENLKAGDFFIQGGEVPTKLGFVVSGILRLFYINEFGIEITKSFCTKNNFVTVYSSLLLNQPSRVFIDVLEDAHLLVVNYDDYKRLAFGNPCWNIINLKLAQGFLINKERRESELLLDDEATRYIRFLNDYPGLENRIQTDYIASYLGMTSESLNQIRSEFRGF